MGKFNVAAWLGCSFATLVGLAALGSSPASAVSSVVMGPSGICPTTLGHTAVGSAGVGNATDCNLVITFNADGSIATTAGPQSTFESVEDALIGVVNNSGHTIFSFNLDGGTSEIMGFDGDGIDLYTFSSVGVQGNITPTAGNPDGTGYGGFNAYFTNISGGAGCIFLDCSGTVNFLNGIASGSHDFFSLEEPASLNLTVRNVPEPLTLSLFSAGLIGAAALRRKAKKKA